MKPDNKMEQQLKSTEVLKALDIILEDLTQEQLQKLDDVAKTVSDPSKMSVKDAISIVNSLGIDIEKLQKNARRKRAYDNEKNRKPRIGANAKCPCGSGDKYKKCCRFKDS